MAVAGPGAAPLPAAPCCHSSSPVSTRMLPGHAACVKGMAVTPLKPLLYTPKSALACTSGQMCIGKTLRVCVRRVVLVEWISFSTKLFLARGMERGHTLELLPLVPLKLRDGVAVPSSWHSSEPLPSRLGRGLGNNTLVYLKVKEKHGKNSFWPFPLAGLEGI